MSKREVKQELQQDEFVDFSHKLGEWLSANKGLLAVALLVAVVAVAAAVYVRQSARQAEVARFQSFAGALSQYNDAMAEYDVEKRRDAMAKAEKLFLEFADGQTGPLADRAVYMAGNAWYHRGVDQKNYEEAKKIFERYLKNAKSAEDKARAHIAIGYCFESMGFLSDDSKLANQAIESFTEAWKAAGDTWMAAEAKLAAARVLSVRGLEGDDKRALALLADVKKSRKPEPVAEIFVDGADMTEREKELLTQALTITTQGGLAKSAELLELRLKGTDYEVARVAAGNVAVATPAAEAAPVAETPAAPAEAPAAETAG